MQNELDRGYRDIPNLKQFRGIIIAEEFNGSK